MAIQFRPATDVFEDKPESLSKHLSQPRSLYAAVYFVLAVLVFLPVAPWSNSSIPAGPLSGGPGAGDPALMTWFLNWTAYALTHGHNIFFTNYLFSPRGTSLFSYTSVPLLGVLGTPLTLKLGSVAAYNLLIRLSLAGCATSMFLVLNSWCRRPYAFAGGLLFGFAPYIMTQSENHLDLAFNVMLPPIVWGVAELLILRRRSPVRLGITIGFFAALQAYVSIEMLTLLAVVLGLGVVVYVSLHRQLLPDNLGGWVRGGGTMALTFVILTGYFLYNFLFGPGHLAGPVFPTSTLQLFHADLLGPLIPTANEVVTSSRLSYLSHGFVSGNITENGAYIGLPLAAVSVYYGLRFRRHLRIVAPLSLAAVALILSLGDRLTVAGHRWPVRLPEALLRYVPLLDNTVPARFGAIVVLFLAVVLAVGTQLLVDSRRASSPAHCAPLWVICAVALSVLVSLLPSVPVTPLAMTTPAGLRADLTKIPLGSEVLVYPFPIGGLSDPLIWQEQSHMRFRLLGGFIRPTSHPDLSMDLFQRFFIHTSYVMSRNLPSRSTLVKDVAVLRRFLQTNHVRAVILWSFGVESLGAQRLLDFGVGPAAVRRAEKYAIWIISR